MSHHISFDLVVGFIVQIVETYLYKMQELFHLCPIKWTYIFNVLNIFESYRQKKKYFWKFERQNHQIFWLMFAPPQSYFLCAGFWWASYFCFEIGSWRLAAFLFGCHSLVGRLLLIRDRKSVLWLKFGLGFYGVLSMVRRLWGGGRWLIFRIVAQLMGAAGVFHLEGVILGWVVAMGGYGFCFLGVASWRGLFLGGDVYFGGCCQVGFD